MSDIILPVLIIVMLTPTGRVFVQRLVLKTGLFGSAEINVEGSLSDRSLNWMLTDLNGNRTRLAELNGQVIFINFWSTWCPPCNAEMPSIISLMEQTDSNVKFIFATTETPEAINKHLAKHDWNIPVFIYDATPGQDLMASSLPTTYIIDKQGNIVHHTAGMKNWDSQDAIELLHELSSSPVD